ncbi:PREDICTED: uncharacterized protein LOC104603561 [Nelumbo nucifera]|uniref:Uncharacterized protein LOC104603561 n=2 Tax=Nelumbo nucifera TaxID=4432 RepID=A0A1U8AS94_NELNU|nr:PREDICTED: uncharacterized protein LOC104603561 [Nelumbo nucifera]DAD30027.1 TPA_asm: hypothetical protein HUJ06_031495 [Nelumbo nucifera]
MESEATQHFSHPHPLNPYDEAQESDGIRCSGCELVTLGSLFGCESCNYYLHEKCLNVGRWMEHPAHPNHPLTLLPVPTYPSGSFLCNACREDGSSFSLSCAHCEFDLHVQCASLPQTVVHEAHPHPLSLTFSYSNPKLSHAESIAFSCDVCGEDVDLQGWLYLCVGCDFGDHLSCATSEARPPPPPPPANEPTSAVEEMHRLTKEMQEFQLAAARCQLQMNLANALASTMRRF